MDDHYPQIIWLVKGILYWIVLLEVADSEVKVRGGRRFSQGLWMRWQMWQ